MRASFFACPFIFLFLAINSPAPRKTRPAKRFARKTINCAYYEGKGGASFLNQRPIYIIFDNLYSSMAESHFHKAVFLILKCTPCYLYRPLCCRISFIGTILYSSQKYSAKIALHFELSSNSKFTIHTCPTIIIMAFVNIIITVTWPPSRNQPELVEGEQHMPRQLNNY